MAEESPPIPENSPVAEYRAEEGSQSALERISKLVPNLTEEVTVATVAADADVSKETARKYLHHFENWNVVVRTGTDPETFVRNESYFEWLRVDTLQREHSTDELQEMLSDLAAEDERLAAEFEVDSPEAVSLLEDGYASADERAERVRRWRSVRNRMDDVVAALRNVLELNSNPANTSERSKRFRISE